MCIRDRFSTVSSHKTFSIRYELVLWDLAGQFSTIRIPKETHNPLDPGTIRHSPLWHCFFFIPTRTLSCTSCYCRERDSESRKLSHIFFAGSHNAKKKSTANKNRITHAGSPGSIVDLSHNRLTIKYWRIWIGIVRQSVIYSKSRFRTCYFIVFLL